MAWICFEQKRSGLTNGSLRSSPERAGRPPSSRRLPPGPLVDYFSGSNLPSMPLRLWRQRGRGTASPAAVLAAVVALPLVAVACGSGTQQSAGAGTLEQVMGRPARSQPEGRSRRPGLPAPRPSRRPLSLHGRRQKLAPRGPRWRRRDERGRRPRWCAPVGGRAQRARALLGRRHQLRACASSGSSQPRPSPLRGPGGETVGDLRRGRR